MNTSLYDQHKAMTETVPIPTLSETPAILRDRAIGEANELRQTNAELREALHGMVGFIDLMRARPYNSPEENEILDTNHRVVRARALLAKVSK